MAFNFPKWIPITNSADLKVLGKLGEESSELATAVSRCIVQGMEGLNPRTQKANRVWLEEEIADVIALINVTIVHFKLNQASIYRRVDDKATKQEHWMNDV